MSESRESSVTARQLSALFATLLIAVACSGPGAPPDGGSAPPPGTDAEVVAVFGDSSIRRAELEERIAGELLQVEQQRHELLEQGLTGLVREKLLELEAAAGGTTGEELLAREVEGRIQQPTDAEVDAFYNQNRARIPQPKEQVAGRIRGFLLQQRRQLALAAYFEGLEARYGVETYLEPLRVSVRADGFPARGPADAPVTLVEFSDFECPYCSQAVPTLDRIVDSYGDQVRLVFRQFPLANIHPNAVKAAEASLCAYEQERFWAMHDAMFADADNLAVAQLKQKAAALGLDSTEFDACLDSGRQAEAVSADVDAGRKAGVSGTPALFINGRFLSGVESYEALAAIIDEELAASS